MARRGVFAQRDFVRLWLAQLVSALGGRVTRTALPIMAVLSVDSSPLALGLRHSRKAFPRPLTPRTDLIDALFTPLGS